MIKMSLIELVGYWEEKAEDAKYCRDEYRFIESYSTYLFYMEKLREFEKQSKELWEEWSQ